MTTSTSTSTLANLPAAGAYDVDAVHSSVGFIVRHLVGAKVRGQFTDFSGTINIAERPEDSSVEATVNAASVTTNNEARDAHLKSPDFFDTESHPTFELRSTSITPNGEDRFELATELTIKGVTRPVTFDLEYLGAGPSMAPGVTAVGFEARAEIDRRDFDVSFAGTLENGSLVVSNKIVIELAIEAHSRATS
jgi:polyisoprenoid-binding protein YceI